MWAFIRRLLGMPAETALERHRRQNARADRANAAYVEARRTAPEPAAPTKARPDRYDRHGIGDLPRPIYPARQTVWLDGDMSGRARSFAVSKTCAWSLERCEEPVASDLGYCGGHTRRVLGASTSDGAR